MGQVRGPSFGRSAGGQVCELGYDERGVPHRIRTTRCQGSTYVSG